MANLPKETSGVFTPGDGLCQRCGGAGCSACDARCVLPSNGLVSRLRGAADGTLRPVHAYSLCAEAADEIERLRRELERYKFELWPEIEAERNRLRAALELYVRDAELQSPGRPGSPFAERLRIGKEALAGSPAEVQP